MSENSKEIKPVSIVMGSDSDLPVMSEAAKFLESLEIAFEIKIVSAHRTADYLYSYSKELVQRDFKVVIAGAGGAAHLPGMVASMTPLPVIGVPIKSRTSLAGLDSILSILQMPPGIPVATMAIDGAKNAGILAAKIIGSSNKDVLERVTNYSKSLEESVVEKRENLEKLGFDAYLKKMLEK